MTPKEAFRYQCYIFHGKKPGKNKVTKRIQREERMKKALTITPEQMASTKALERAQQATNQPYMLLSQPAKSQK
jgi:U4/U6.U5 tri-snRNP-associated protein 1